MARSPGRSTRKARPDRPLKTSGREPPYKALIENTVDLLSVLGADGVMLYVSPSHKRVLGYEPEELVGRNAFGFVHPDDAAAIGQMFNRGVGDGRGTGFKEFRFRHKDGSWRHIEGVAKVRLNDPEIAGVIVSSHDITERKQDQEILQRLTVELEQLAQERAAQLALSNKELEAFGYSVAHDLRAPLRVIEGFSQIIMEDHGAALGEDGRGHLARVQASARRVALQVESLRNLSRLAREEMRSEPVNLSAVASAVVDGLRRGDPDREVEVVIEPEVVVRGDPRMLRLALENLLGNAWKFSATQAHSLIEFGGVRRAGEWVVHVRDSGVGFDMAYANKLFKTFHRLHSSNEFGGIGVGLAAVKRVVERHGGRVWAESDTGRGATFYFTLPEESGGSGRVWP